jgi:hypothetical protein
MHTLLDLRGSIPSFIRISDGKMHDVHALDMLLPEPGAIYVMDRGYIDFARLYVLQQAGAFFGTRQIQSRCAPGVFRVHRSPDRRDRRPDHRPGRREDQQGLAAASRSVIPPGPRARAQAKQGGRVLDLALALDGLMRQGQRIKIHVGRKASQKHGVLIDDGRCGVMHLRLLSYRFEPSHSLF